MKYEYFKAANFDSKQLNEMGLNGWELITVVGHGMYNETFTYYFKRPLP